MSQQDAAFELLFDPTTALVVVDVQNDFGDPAGSLYVPGGEAVVSVINRLIKSARAAGSPVIYTADWHPARTPHFDTDGGPWPVHCVTDTWGAQFVPGLTPDPDAVIRKGSSGEDGYSGFSTRNPLDGRVNATELHGLLTAAGVDHIVVVGLATDYCIKATVLDGRGLDLRVDVVRDAIRAVNLTDGDGARAEGEMIAAGANLI